MQDAITVNDFLTSGQRPDQTTMRKFSWCIHFMTKLASRPYYLGSKIVNPDMVYVSDRLANLKHAIDGTDEAAPYRRYDQYVYNGKLNINTCTNRVQNQGYIVYDPMDDQVYIFSSYKELTDDERSSYITSVSDNKVFDKINSELMNVIDQLTGFIKSAELTTRTRLVVDKSIYELSVCVGIINNAIVNLDE